MSNFSNVGLERFKVRRTTLDVDVEAVERVVHDAHIGTEALKRLEAGRRAGTVTTIKSDLHTGKVDVIGKDHFPDVVGFRKSAQFRAVSQIVSDDAVVTDDIGRTVFSAQHLLNEAVNDDIDTQSIIVIISGFSHAGNYMPVQTADTHQLSYFIRNELISQEINISILINVSN